VVVIIAVGVNTGRRRDVPGMEIGTSEAEPIWTESIGDWPSATPGFGTRSTEPFPPSDFMQLTSWNETAARRNLTIREQT
jgi:hypothetical protein